MSERGSGIVERRGKEWWDGESEGLRVGTGTPTHHNLPAQLGCELVEHVIAEDLPILEGEVVVLVHVLLYLNRQLAALHVLIHNLRVQASE